jgi:hypothetical protein
MADAEWLRTCEAVRRFAPPVGQLGEWRALCEGGWTRDIPRDLTYSDQPQQSPMGALTLPPTRSEEEDQPAPRTVKVEDVESKEDLRREVAKRDRFEERHVAAQSNDRREWEYASSAVRTTSGQQHIRPNQFNTTASSEQSQSHSSTSLDQPQVASDNERDSRSPEPHATLASFPAPPTHLPLPPLSSPSQPQSSRQHTSRASSVSPQLIRLAESPIENDVETDKPPVESHNLPVSQAFFSPHQSTDNILPAEPRIGKGEDIANAFPPDVGLGYQNAAGPYRNADYSPEERDNGAGTDSKTEGYAQVHPRNIDRREKFQGVERSDTGESSGSIVAAMRRRYSQQVSDGSYNPEIRLTFCQSEATSSVPKDVPRLPLSVTDLSIRYQPVDGPSSPLQRTISPPNGRQLHKLPIDTQGRNAGPQYPGHNERSPPPEAHKPVARPVASQPSPLADNDPHLLRRQRLDEQAERELRDKEVELRARERDIEMRVRELDMERARLTNERGDMYRGDTSPQSNSPHPFPSPQQQQQQQQHWQQQQQLQQQQHSRIEFPVPLPAQPRHSYNSAHLAPPSSQSPASSSPRQRHHSLSQTQHQQSRPQESPQAQARKQSEPEHAPYCGCNQCSVSKYKTSGSVAPSPQDLRPPEQPINLRPQAEKPKGWIRRLSMPVGMSNAFSLDSKKSSGTLRNVMEDGRIDRRSFETSAVSNRSMTNLGRR